MSRKKKMKVNKKPESGDFEDNYDRIKTCFNTEAKEKFLRFW